MKIFFTALADASRIPVAGLPCAGFGDGAGDGESRHGAEGIDEGCGWVGRGQHVGGFDVFPTADAGTVETKACRKNFLVQLAHGHRKMLPDAEGIDKLDFDHPGNLPAGPSTSNAIGRNVIRRVWQALSSA